MVLFTPPAPIEAAFNAVKAKVDKQVHSLARAFLSGLDIEVPSELEVAFLGAAEGGKRFRAFSAISGAAVGRSVLLAKTLALGGSEDSRPEAPCSDDAVGEAAKALLQAADDESVLNLAVALEFYQGAALVHDDILDKSDTRRGRPTVHVALTSHHQRTGLFGSGPDFGVDAAILVGDLLLAAAEFSLSLSTGSLGGKRGAQLLRRYSQMAGEVAVGQYWDTSITYAPLSASTSSKGDADVLDADVLERTLAVVRSKSARYSVVNPAVLGAIAVGAPTPLAPTLEKILEPAGIAFQLRDDALGVFGLEDETGKPTGIDIREGKRTVLLALTLGSAPAQAALRLQEIYTKDSPSDEDVASASQVIAAHGSPAHEKMIQAFVRETKEELTAAELPGSAQCLAHFLTHLLVDRSF